MAGLPVLRRRHALTLKRARRGGSTVDSDVGSYTRIDIIGAAAVRLQLQRLSLTRIQYSGLCSVFRARARECLGMRLMSCDCDRICRAEPSVAVQREANIITARALELDSMNMNNTHSSAQLFMCRSRRSSVFC